MADDRRGRGIPPPRDPQEVPYPPGEEDAASYQSHALPSTSQPQRQMAVQLPSIHDTPLYGPQPSGRGGYPHHQDPRSPGGYGHSPTNANGYQPPPSSQAYLPPVQQSPANYGQEYYSPQRGSYGGGFDPYRQPHPGPYPGDRGYLAEYGRGAPPATAAPLQQAAPRQRTSIACKYCRRRKIRCSGYQNAPGGKCQNCIKMNQDCIFQPVSSSTSTAFVPISAVQGGLPPGTPLYGAYGQPLSTVAAPPGPHSAGLYPPDYQALPSPPGPYPAPQYHEEPEQGGRRRHRPPEDDPVRLPPPTPYSDEDPRRRSPATSTSSTQYSQRGPYDAGSGTPTPRASPGTAHAGQSPASTGSNVMSLGHLIEHPSRSGSVGDIDRSMLGRLDRRHG